MKNSSKVLASGLALTLLFSQGLSTVDAKGHKEKQKEKSTHVADKNKNEISDKWEKKYKLKGKSLAKQDYDKDGLSNLLEYKLNLNPLKADSNNDGVLDGQEDGDHDGLSNVSEIELGTNPVNSDTDHDKVKDGAEKSQAGVKLSNTIKDLQFDMKSADNKDMKVEYEYNKKGKMMIKIEDETNTLTKEMISSLVSEFQDASKLTSDEIVAKIQTILNVQDLSNVQFNVEYFNGRDFEVKHDENIQGDETDNKDDQQVNDQEDGNKDDQQVNDQEDGNKDDQQVNDQEDGNKDDQQVNDQENPSKDDQTQTDQVESK